MPSNNRKTLSSTVMKTSRPKGIPMYAAIVSRRTSARSASARLCTACHVVTKIPVSELTTTAIFGSIANVISGTASRAKPKPATICMNAAMKTAAPTTISWAVVTSIDSGTAGPPTLQSMLPIIDLHARTAAAEIDQACREFGFFAIRNHGVDDDLRESVLKVAIDFFGRDENDKEARRPGPRRTGVAWMVSARRRADFGRAGSEGGLLLRPRAAGRPRPMHGPNIWPTEPAALRPLITEWMATMEPLAQHVLSLMAEGLGLAPDFFRDDLTADPTPLFRIFRYPPHPPDSADRWGVAEHSDYGLLTLLAHDGTAGCRSKSATSGSTRRTIRS